MISVLVAVIMGALLGGLGSKSEIGGIDPFGIAWRTALAFMLPPVTLLATLNYWKEGYVNWKYALILSLMFFIGAYLGSFISFALPDRILRKIFGVFIMIVALKMIFSK